MKFLILLLFIQLFIICRIHCQITSDEYHSKHTHISLPSHNSKAIMPNVAVSQTPVSPTTSVIKTKKLKKKHHHHKHKHHHKKHKHNTSKSLRTELATRYAVSATTSPYLGQITVSTSQTPTQTSVKTSVITTVNSIDTFSTDKSYDLSKTETKQTSSTTDNDYYFIRETPTSMLPTSTIISSKTITSTFSKTTARLLTPPRDRPMRDKRTLSSSFIISFSISPSPSIIQPMPAKVPNSSSRVLPPTASNTDRDSDDDNSAYHHKAQIHSSNRDLGLGLGLGFGGFSILALIALLIQNCKKRQRNHSSFRTSNQIDNNGVFFTETPSMFRRKSASRNSKQNSLISTKWRPHSFLSVVANVIASKFPKRSSNSSFSHFGESGTVDYDSLTYPQPLYSPVKATYQDM